jgi:hypothetical protein
MIRQHQVKDILIILDKSLDQCIKIRTKFYCLIGFLRVKAMPTATSKASALKIFSYSQKDSDRLIVFHFTNSFLQKIEHWK